MFSVNKLSYGYSEKNLIINNLFMELDTNIVTGLTGSSGCGKSTLGKLLAGYLKPISGEISFNGKPVENIQGYNPVQMIHQHPEQSMDPLWKMEKVLNEARGISQTTKTALGIRDIWMQRYPSELSGGEMQRFSIARALCDGVKYIIADEISTMLDAVTQSNIWHALLKEVKLRNIGLLVITHNMNLAKIICDKIISFSDIKKY